MRFFKTTILTVLIVSCAPVRVSYDFEETTNFDDYKTYQYFADMETGLNELDTNRLLDALDVKMTSKGYSISKTPDFYIDIKSRALQPTQRGSFGIGMGSSGGYSSGGVSVGIPIGQGNINYQVTLDFVDHEKKQLFWQAVSESSFNPKTTPEAKEQLINALAEKVLSQYPPEKK